MNGCGLVVEMKYCYLIPTKTEISRVYIRKGTGQNSVSREPPYKFDPPGESLSSVLLVCIQDLTLPTAPRVSGSEPYQVPQSVTVRLLDFGSFCTVLSHVIRGHPGGLFKPSRGNCADRIFLSSMLSSIRAICPKRERRLYWTVEMRSARCQLQMGFNHRGVPHSLESDISRQFAVDFQSLLWSRVCRCSFIYSLFLELNLSWLCSRTDQA